MLPTKWSSQLQRFSRRRWKYHPIVLTMGRYLASSSRGLPQLPLLGRFHSVPVPPNCSFLFLFTTIYEDYYIVYSRILYTVYY